MSLPGLAMKLLLLLAAAGLLGWYYGYSLLFVAIA